MSSNLIFYTHPMSRGRLVRWMLEEVGVPYETKVMDFDTSLKSDEYAAINPMLKVPAIVHGGEVVTECAAICAYLADAFPEKGLAPPLNERSSYYRWLLFAAGPVEQACVSSVLGTRVSEEQEGMVGYGSLARVQDTLEHWFSNHEYVAGRTFTAADVYVGSQIQWNLTMKVLEARPNISDYAQRIHSRPACIRAGEIDDEWVAENAPSE